MMRSLLVVVLSALFSAGFLIAAQEQPTHETDELRLQIVMLKSQLAQALNLAAKCEHEGSQSGKIAQEASTAAQTLMKDLDARGLMIDPRTNTIVAKPPAEAPPPADQP